MNRRNWKYAQSRGFARTKKASNSSGLDACDVPGPIPVNPADVQANVRETKRQFARIPHEKPTGRPNPTTWFINQVKTGGPWDYKRGDPTYQDYGNWHFGIVAKAAGFSDRTTLTGAGLAHRRDNRGRYDPTGTPFILAPYWDDPRDQVMIARGINYFNNCLED